LALSLAGFVALCGAAAGQAVRPAARVEQESADSAAANRRPPRMEVLSDAEWARIDESIKRALRYLVSQQAADGSFLSADAGQPAVTAFCVMAFLSAGYQPGEGMYGRQLQRAIDFALQCQRQDGLFSLANVDQPIEANWGGASHAATYNHAITGLMLGEVFGQTTQEQAQRIRPAIDRAIAYTRRLQQRPKAHPVDFGGVRYIRDVQKSSSGGGGDGDLSCTSWHLMFLRSAKNAGFQVPVEYVDQMLQFVNNCYDRRSGGFNYSTYTNGKYQTRGMTGAGVLCLFLSGKYDREIEVNSGRWILERPFRPYRVTNHNQERYHYSAYYCSQAALMLGGQHWEKFYPDFAAVLLENQERDGSWPPEREDQDFGRTYTTALSVLSLTPPYQLLPIYQR
jgi:hypothetical protein